MSIAQSSLLIRFCAYNSHLIILIKYTAKSSLYTIFTGVSVLNSPITAYYTEFRLDPARYRTETVIP